MPGMTSKQELLFLTLALVAVSIEGFGVGFARPLSISKPVFKSDSSIAAQRFCLRKPSGFARFSATGDNFEDDDHCEQGDGENATCDLAYTNSGRIARRDIKHLLDNNQAWIQKKKEQDPNFFDKLGAQHKPTVFWIGDADSRVAANEIIGAEPGEVFVHRNIGNLVIDIDSNLMSCLQYAVDVLQVEHIIVCGNYHSGAIEKALSTVDFASPLENWLSHIRYVYRLHRDELTAISDKRALQRRLVELNVIEQCLHVYQLAIVQRRRFESSKTKPYATPRIFAVVYDVETGLLTRLKWVPDGIEEKYGLYHDLTDPSGELSRRGGPPTAPLIPVPLGISATVGASSQQQPPQPQEPQADVVYSQDDMDLPPRRKSFWRKLIGINAS